MNLRTDQTKYRTYLEEGHNANEVDAWRFFECRGRYGSIWPYSNTYLACLVLSNRIGEMVKRDYPHWKLTQDGENETTFILENKFLDEAADVISARKKRRMSPDQLEQSIKRLAKYRYNTSKPEHSEGLK